MPICRNCPYIKLIRKQHRVYVASENDLRSPLYLNSLKAAMGMLGLPRRRWRDAIADALCAYEGDFVGPRGEIYMPPEIDDAFPEHIDQRWISDFIARRFQKGTPVRLHKRSIERIRLIDLYFRLRYPEVVANFCRFDPANDNEPKLP